jgi:hypothetical protein
MARTSTRSAGVMPGHAAAIRRASVAGECAALAALARVACASLGSARAHLARPAAAAMRRRVAGSWDGISPSVCLPQTVSILTIRDMASLTIRDNVRIIL